MRKIIYIPILFFVFALFSCDRTFDTDIESTTPPELHVIVQDSDEAPVEGADVTLYTSEEDYESESNELSTKTTNGDGKAVFTESDLKEPGFFYVRATYEALDNSASNIETPYILLNDGHTYFYTIIE